MNNFYGEINGVKSMIRIFIENGEVKSMNTFPGWSSRKGINPDIFFDNLYW